MESIASIRKTPIRFERDIVAVIESNLDDITGEVLARSIERLLEEGAYDATATTYLGKKGRLGHTIRAVCSTDATERIAQVMVEETGTLGVKVTEFTRLIVPRRVVAVPVSIEGYTGKVSVKLTESRGKIIRIKPEISEAKLISENQKIPLREVLERIVSSARSFLSNSTVGEPEQKQSS